MKKLKKTLVTGGSGFIGSHLCEELLAQGYHVTAIDNLATSTLKNIIHLRSHKKFHFVRGSIFNRAKMQDLVKKSDIVFHLAASVGVKYILDHPVQSIVTNVEGTHIVLGLAAKYKKRILCASSSEIYGKHGFEPLREDTDRVLGPTTVPRWSYANAKAMDEFLAMAYAREEGLKVILLRFFNVVGPRQVGDYGMVIPRLVRSALSHKPMTIFGDGTQIRSFVYVEDVVDAMIGLSHNDKAYGKVYNIGDDEEPVSIKQLARMIRNKTHSRSKIIFKSYASFYGKDFEDVAVRIPDITRLKKMIGYEPKYNLNSILDEIIQAFPTSKK